MLKLDLQQAYDAICGEIGHLEIQKGLIEERIAQKKQDARALNKVRAMAAPVAAPAKETPDDAHAPAASPLGDTGSDRPAANEAAAAG